MKLKELLGDGRDQDDRIHEINQLEAKMEVYRLGSVLYFLLASTKESSGHFCVRLPYPLSSTQFRAPIAER